MYLVHNKENVRSIRSTFIWCLLAFLSGMINSFSYHRLKLFVSHVTGTSTTIGMAMADHQWKLEFEVIGIFFSFMLGTFAAVKLIGPVIWKHQLKELYWTHFIVSGILLTMLVLMTSTSFSWLTQLETYIEVESFLLAFLCGLINSSAVLCSHGLIRVTHMTGVATDIGMAYGKYLFHPNRQERYLEKKLFWERVSKLCSFIIGAYWSALLFREKPSYALSCIFALSLVPPALHHLKIKVIASKATEQQEKQGEKQQIDQVLQ